MANMRVYYPDVKVAKGYVTVNDIKCFCTVHYTGCSYDTAVVKIYPKIKGYSYSYVYNGGSSWNKMPNNGLRFEMHSNYFTYAMYSFNTQLDILIRSTGLNIFVESTKF